MTTTRFLSGDSVPAVNPANVPCFIGVCSDGDPGTIYSFSPGDQVAQSLGGGPLVHDVLWYLRQDNAGEVRVSPATPSWGTLASITKVGGHSGPTITAALVDSTKGPFMGYRMRLRVKNGGALGFGSFEVAYDGDTYVEEYPLPSEGEAVLTGTVDLAAQVYPWSTLNGKTLVFTDPTSTTITFASAPTSPQDVVDDFNTLAQAAPLAVRARVAEGTGDDLGKQFFELYSTAVGTAAEITVDATSTGEGTLGISTTTAAGSDATWTPTYSNVEYTFPSGTYTAGHVYSQNLVGPRASISALAQAAVDAHDDYPHNPFGFLVVAQEADTSTNCKALKSAFASLCETWKADGDAPVFSDFVIGSPWHTASSSLATNDANIAATRSSLLAAFNGDSASMDANVAFADVYLDGSTDLHLGSFRRPASVLWAWAAGCHLFSLDPGDGSFTPPTGATLLAPDGLTRAADDTRGTAKLGRGDGPGFAAVRSKGGDLGRVGFKPGATRAGASSRFAYRGRVSLAYALARVLWPAVDEINGQSLDPDPVAGTLADDVTEDKQGHLQALADQVWKPSATIRHATLVRVTIDNSGNFSKTGDVPVTVTVVPKGVAEDASITFKFVGTVTTFNG